jgi:hypothetical protein
LSIFPLSASAGQQFTTSSNITYIFNGESWIVISTKGILTCTSSTRPGSPTEGQLIFETDTDQVLVYDGTAFVEISGGGGGTVLFQDSQPDVSALETGALWIDSNENVGTGLDIQTFLRWSKTLSASTSTISGYDDNTNNLLYTPGFELVYINGTLINRGIDYTATSGNTVALTEAASAGDLIEIHAFESFILSDMYTKNESDNRYATQENLNNIDLSATIQTASAAAVTYLVDGAPEALNTLNELSEALNDNADILDLYLTQSGASSTYLTQSNGITAATASATYIPQSSPVTGFKNKIINGGFDIWQRGTSFSSPSSGSYSADRFFIGYDGTGATRTISRQPFTPGNAIPGYEPQFFYRYNQSVAGSGGTYMNILHQRIEDVRTFSGQEITISFWAKSDASRSMGVVIGQYFGTGGSTTVYNLTATHNITTSWNRYYTTINVPSISEKTIGTGVVAFELTLNTGPNTTCTFDIWGIQIEKGSLATEFEQRFIGDELRMCQRYYETGIFGNNSYAAAYTPNVYPGSLPGFNGVNILFKVTKRITPHTVPNLTLSGMWVAPGSFGVTDNTSHTFVSADVNSDGFKFISNRVVGNNTPTTSSMYFWEGNNIVWNASAEL